MMQSCDKVYTIMFGTFGCIIQPKDDKKGMFKCCRV